MASTPSRQSMCCQPGFGSREVYGGRCIDCWRTEAERLREALDGLTIAADEFLTAAAYSVRASIEEEFVAALDDARGALNLEASK